jgi:hypothetical protein
MSWTLEFGEWVYINKAVVGKLRILQTELRSEKSPLNIISQVFTKVRIDAANSDATQTSSPIPDYLV